MVFENLSSVPAGANESSAPAEPIEDEGLSSPLEDNSIDAGAILAPGAAESSTDFGP